MDPNKKINIIQRYLKQYNIEQIFDQGFKYWKYFCIRFDYSLSDYRNRRILILNQSIRNALFISTIGWCIIISLTYASIKQENPLFVSIKSFEKMLSSQRNDLLVLELVFIFIIIEITWLFLFNDVFEYHCSESDFFAYRRWTIFETNQLDKHGRKHLICFYIITNLISSSIHCIAKIGLFSVDIMFTICSLIFYSHDHITLIQLINTVPGIIILSLYIDFMIGLLCHSINFVIFIIEFFKIWLNKLFSLFNQMNKRIKRRKELMKRMYWNQFHNQYIKLFAKIGYFNHTVSTLLLCIEFISKSAIMMSCIYYSRQEKMGVHNTTCIICFLSAFFYATSLYVIISGLHSANYSYTISILNWITT